MKGSHSQYTLRKVPPSVDRALRERARRLGRSLNQVAVEALAQGVGQGTSCASYADLDAFFGSWTADPKVDKALADQRKIDAGAWT